jgi:hypothetical protein
MEPSDIRKRVLHTLEQARRRAAAHREEASEATRAFEALLPAAAAAWRVAANVLRAEGHAFTVHTPAAALRFASERSAEDFVEVTLDTTRRPVAVIGRTGLARGRRIVDRETTVAQGDQILALTDEGLLQFLLGELEPFVER